MPSASEDEDATDVASAQAGDEAAFERIYRRHAARVHTLARRLLGAAAAEDGTQEVFVRAWRKLGGFRARARFSTWLHRLAVRALLNHRRGSIHCADETADGTLAIEPLARVEALDLERAIEQLPRAARQVFVLHDIEGLTHGEISELMRIDAGTSKSQLHRARAILRQELSR